MQAVTTIGLDIAKSVFQVRGVEAEARLAAEILCGNAPCDCEVVRIPTLAAKSVGHIFPHGGARRRTN